jgi:methionyl-tRNA formyltransferase
MTKADKINATEAAVDFAHDSALAIHNKVRGFAGWPGTWSLFDLEGEAEPLRLKIVTTRVVPPGGEEAAAAPAGGKGGGEVVLVGKKALRLRCADGSALDLLAVQPPGKKVMEGRAFANGLRGRALRWRPLDAAVPAAKPA